MKSNKYQFVKVRPDYTGGGIYVFLGKLKNGQWFLADSDNLDVRLIDTDVFKASDDDIWQPDWQEEHLITDLSEEESQLFISAMLDWIKEHKPTGNYSMGELENLMKRVKMTTKNGPSESCKESFQDIEDDFNQARVYFNSKFKYIDFDYALERWNRTSPNSEWRTFYAKPLYNQECWKELIADAEAWDEDEMYRHGDLKEGKNMDKIKEVNPKDVEELNEGKTSEGLLFIVKLNGHEYSGYGEVTDTRLYVTEHVRIYNRAFNVVGYGKYKWQNRPWERFKFASALEKAVISLFGEKATSKIENAVESSSDCQEAMDKFAASWDEEEKTDKPVAESKGKGMIDVLGKVKAHESYNYKDLINAVKDAYGFTNKEAVEYIKNTDNETRAELIKGFKDNAKKSFLTDGLDSKKHHSRKLKEAAGNPVDAEIHSDEGFYVGDICYALDRDTYDNVWGGAGYKDGEYEVRDGLKFAVGGTTYGDGEYYDQKGHAYGVDAGVIGIVPLELATRYDLDMLNRLGQVFRTPGTAYFEAEDGVFTAHLPGSAIISINTADEEDEYDEYDEEEDWEENPDDVDESCKINEAPRYDLAPEYDSRQSFYHKAKVDVDDKGGNKLYSYGTLVAEMKDGKPVVYGTYSATTLRHIKEWLKQNGFKADTAKQIMKDYSEKYNESLKESNNEIARKGFMSLIKYGDHPWEGYAILNDGYFVKRIYSEYDEDAISQFEKYLEKKKK